MGLRKWAHGLGLANTSSYTLVITSSWMNIRSSQANSVQLVTPTTCAQLIESPALRAQLGALRIQIGSFVHSACHDQGNKGKRWIQPGSWQHYLNPWKQVCPKANLYLDFSDTWSSNIEPSLNTFLDLLIQVPPKKIRIFSIEVLAT